MDKKTARSYRDEARGVRFWSAWGGLLPLELPL